MNFSLSIQNRASIDLWELFSKKNKSSQYFFQPNKIFEKKEEKTLRKISSESLNIINVASGQAKETNRN